MLSHTRNRQSRLIKVTEAFEAFAAKAKAKPNCLSLRLTQSQRATSIGTSDLYRIIGSYANQSADIADPVEPIERSSSLSGNLVTERFI